MEQFQNDGIIGGGATASLTVNGTVVGGFIVGPGESRSITMSDINSIGIIGAGTNSSNVKVSFSINYKFFNSFHFITCPSCIHIDNI